MDINKVLERVKKDFPDLHIELLEEEPTQIKVTSGEKSKSFAFNKGIVDEISRLLQKDHTVNDKDVENFVCDVLKEEIERNFY